MTLRSVSSSIVIATFTLGLGLRHANAQKIYWTDSIYDRMQRSNLDGSNVETLVTNTLVSPGGLALDPAGGKVYWTDLVTHNIHRADMDGSNAEILIEGLANVGIAVDPGAGKMYWTDGAGQEIYRANMDGSGIESLVTTVPRYPFWIDLALTQGNMYWNTFDNFNEAIHRADLDGTGVETLLTMPDASIEGLALDEGLGKMYWTRTIGGDRIQRANLDGTNIEDVFDIPDGNTPLGIALDGPGGKVYWARVAGNDDIQRADLDGANVEDLITSETAWQIELDLAAGHIYWTRTAYGKIERANLDGTNQEVVVRNTLENVRGMAVDLAGGLVYFTDRESGKVQRMPVGGGGENIEDLITAVDRPEGIALDVAAGKMYWVGGLAAFGTAMIQRANLDGSNVEPLVSSGLTAPRGIALDLSGGKMYVIGSSELFRANLDGSAFESFPGINAGPGIAVDIAAGKLYLSKESTRRIQRTNLDGSDIEVLVQLDWFPDGIALDLDGGKIYWALRGLPAKIQRANLDGTNVEDLVTTGLNNPRAIALDITPPPPEIPTVSQWALCVMTLLLLTAGTLVFRPRRLRRSLGLARLSPSLGASPSGTRYDNTVSS